MMNRLATFALLAATLSARVAAFHVESGTACTSVGAACTYVSDDSSAGGSKSATVSGFCAPDLTCASNGATCSSDDQCFNYCGDGVCGGAGAGCNTQDAYAPNQIGIACASGYTCSEKSSVGQCQKGGLSSTSSTSMKSTMASSAASSTASSIASSSAATSSAASVVVTKTADTTTTSTLTSSKATTPKVKVLQVAAASSSPFSTTPSATKEEEAPTSNASSNAKRRVKRRLDEVRLHHRQVRAADIRAKHQ